MDGGAVRYRGHLEIVQRERVVSLRLAVGIPMGSTTSTRDRRSGHTPVRVLFVEMDELFVDVARTVFEDEFDIDVTIVSERDDVFRSVESADCIVHEIRPSDSTGLDLIEAVRTSHRDLPYVVVSSASDEDLVGGALVAGATDFLRTEPSETGYRWLALRLASTITRRHRTAENHPGIPIVDVTEGSSLLDESLTFVAVTTSFADVHGYSRSALIGERLEAVCPDSEAKRLDEIRKRARTRGSATSESIARRSDGTTFPSVLSVDYLGDDLYVCTVFQLADHVGPIPGAAVRPSIESEHRLRRLEQLCTASAGSETRSAQEVCDGVVETIANGDEAASVGVYLYDESTDSLRRRAVTPRLEESDSRFPFDGDSTLAWQAFVEREPVLVTDLVPRPAGSVSDPDRARGIVVPLGSHGILVAGRTGRLPAGRSDVEGHRSRPNNSHRSTPDNSHRSTPNSSHRSTPDNSHRSTHGYAFVRLVGATAGTVLDRLDAERQLGYCTDHLESIERENERFNERYELVRSVGRILETAWTRDELERRTCERIVRNDCYSFTRVADYADVSDKIRDRAGAGSEKGYLESLETSVTALIEDGEPMARTIRSREPVTIRHLLSGSVDEHWRQDAVIRGYRSVVAVPIVFRERTYGGLAVYSERGDAFDELDREVFTDLGSSIGHAIHAIESKTALVGRGSVELEFRVRDREIQFHEWARETGCTLVFETVTSRSDGSIRGLFTIEGAPVDTILDLARRSPAVTDTRLRTERGDKHLFQCTLTEESVVARLLEYGAVPKRIFATEAEGCLVVTLPTSANVREFVEVFTRLYPNSTLVRRQDHEYVTNTTYGFLQAVEDRLTQKQFEALETAFVSGYFEVPRDSTGEEVADILDVTQPTFNHHLRAAQRKLFSMLFEEKTDGEI